MEPTELRQIVTESQLFNLLFSKYGIMKPKYLLNDLVMLLFHRLAFEPVFKNFEYSPLVPTELRRRWKFAWSKLGIM